MFGVLCVIGGFFVGAYLMNSYEGSKEKEGKCTTYDGVLYKYVKVNVDNTGKIKT